MQMNLIGVYETETESESQSQIDIDRVRVGENKCVSEELVLSLRSQYSVVLSLNV